MEQEQKKTSGSWKHWLVIGITGLVVAAGFVWDFTGDGASTESAIELSVSVGVTTALQEHPETLPYFVKASSVMEAAVNSQDGDVQALAEELSSLLGEDDTPLSRLAIKLVIAKLDSIDVEKLDKEQIKSRLRAVAAGLKGAIQTTNTQGHVDTI